MVEWRRMSLRGLNIAVVGAGTAGSAATLFLARAGHAVALFEAVEEPGPVGAGIMIQPTGMHVLDELGLLEQVLARGSRVERLRCVTRGRRAVIDLRYGDVHPGAFGLGLHRGVLFEALFDAVRTEKVTLHLGRTVARLSRARGKVTLHEESGAKHGPFDLLVVADGARSALRGQTGLVERATVYPWGALWFIGDDPERRFDGTLFQVVDGTEHMLGLLPSGLGPSGDTSRVSLFWSLRADRVDAWHAEGLEAWRRLLTAIEPRSEPLLAQIEDADEVLFARYWDVALTRWHERDVVVLGDAAHATSPQLGQGANLALWDAWELARAMEREATLDGALERYSGARRAHLGYYQWATRALTPFFQSDLAPLGWARDALMGAACKLPYLRTRMIRTMCGLERGVLLSESLPMPPLPTMLPPGERAGDGEAPRDAAALDRDGSRDAGGSRSARG